MKRARTFIATALIGGAVIAVGASEGTATAATESVVFTLTTPGCQDYTPPAGATELVIEVAGGRGSSPADAPGPLGGMGGLVKGTHTINPGETYQACVGASDAETSAFLAGGPGGFGGDNAGGGGALFGTTSPSAEGGMAITGLIAVAGGGGGGGRLAVTSGDVRGFSEGAAGGSSVERPAECGPLCGGQGTATDGGAGGPGSGTGARAGESGRKFVGGRGGAATFVSSLISTEVSGGGGVPGTSGAAAAGPRPSPPSTTTPSSGTSTVVAVAGPTTSGRRWPTPSPRAGSTKTAPTPRSRRSSLTRPSRR